MGETKQKAKNRNRKRAHRRIDMFSFAWYENWKARDDTLGKKAVAVRAATFGRATDNRSMASTRMIAQRSVDLLNAAGERVSLRVEFGPVRAFGQEFRCRVRFHGWGDSPPDIRGYDSLQALMLAVEFVRTVLVDYVRHGGRVVWPGTSNDYELDDFALRRAKGEPSADAPLADGRPAS